MKVLNFNDPYVDSKGNVNNLEDVLSDISVDLTDYAKKTDIPATLPANGGNSDTVNNHTVESDVPVNAKFTDTIYDDTEVKGSIEELKNDLVASNAGAHNSVYRGKYLGNALTTEQKAQISAGTFNDLYIGDYWTIEGVNYRIAAFDYWLNCGDVNCVTHHVVIVPDTCLYNAKMNDSDVTTGGYMGSAMHTTNLEQAKITIKSAFNGHVLNHRNYLVNAVTNGCSSGGEWTDSEVDLMNEQMVYGGILFSPTSDGSNIPSNYRVEKSQLPLFVLEPSRIINRDNYWLRDVVSTNSFARVGDQGYAGSYSANYSFGVRPAFGITG